MHKLTQNDFINPFCEISALAGRSRMVLVSAFSPDGKRVVIGSRDKLAKNWNAETGAEVGILE